MHLSKSAHIHRRAGCHIGEQVAVSEGRSHVQWEELPSHRDILKSSVFHRFQPLVAAEGLHLV